MIRERKSAAAPSCRVSRLSTVDRDLYRVSVITQVAVVPYPPLLVPELTVRAGAEIEQLRATCLRAVSSLTESTTEWVAVGVDRSGPLRWGPDTKGTFAGFGADVAVGLDDSPVGAPPDPRLPLPVLIAGWLRAQVSAARVTAHVLAADTSPEECRAYGARLAIDDGGPVGMLVLADGTNRRDARSPYLPDERAEPADADLRHALADVDLPELLDLDPMQAAELGIEGRAALQALAGAVESTGGSWCGELLYSDTPLGVTYHVAVWSQRP